MRSTLGLATFFLAIAVTNTGQAALIAGWDFNDGRFPGGTGVWGPSPAAPTSSDANVTAGGLTRGSGVATPGASSAAANAWGGTGWDGNATAAAAIAAGDYATFTVAANSGYELSLTSIEPYNVRRSGTGPTTGLWQYSLDGSIFTDLGAAITWGGTTTVAGNPQLAIDLSGITALQNLDDTTTVTFRVVNYSASGAAGTWYLNTIGAPANALDFQVHGTVAEAVVVPEPASVTLVVLAGLAIFGVRRSSLR